MKLQEYKGQYSVTLPKQIIIALGWSKHTKLYYKLDKAKLILSKDI